MTDIRDGVEQAQSPHSARVLPPVYRVGLNTLTVAANRVYLCPLQVFFPVYADRVIMILNAGVSAGNARVGIYRDNGDTPAGGELVVESASIAKGAAWAAQEFTIAETYLSPGLYWVAYLSDEATTQVQQSSFGNANGLTIRMCYYALVYGALTDPCPAITNGAVPTLWLRVRV